MTLVPLACVTMASLGLLLGTSFEPRNIGLMFGFIILPVTFLGGTYYAYTRLAPVQVGGWHWLQTLVLVNPLIYINEGMRAAFTDAPHMPLYVIYPGPGRLPGPLPGLGLRNFRRQGAGLTDPAMAGAGPARPRLRAARATCWTTAWTGRASGSTAIAELFDPVTFRHPDGHRGGRGLALLGGRCRRPDRERVAGAIGSGPTGSVVATDLDLSWFGEPPTVGVTAVVHDVTTDPPREDPST